MIVCDYCTEEIESGTQRLQVRAVIDNAGVAQQPVLTGDLHPECLEPFYAGARAIHGTRPSDPTPPPA